MNKIFADFLTRITSRKFLLVIALGLILLADNSGLNLDPGIRKNLVQLVIGYLIAQGAVEAVAKFK